MRSLDLPFSEFSLCVCFGFLGKIAKMKTQGSHLPVLAIIFVFIGLGNAHLKLNVPRFRLPLFETASANFTLRVESPGCYIW